MINSNLFFSKVNKTNSCWLWTGCKRREYGAYGKNTYAHRISWELHFGKIPTTLFVLHKCDVPLCVNPEHLFLGTPQDNMADRDKKERQAKGTKVNTCKLTETEVIEIRLLYKTKLFSHSELAKLYNMSKAPITKILTYKNWKHI